MKKQSPGILPAVACVLLAFVLGLCLGRTNRDPVTVTQTSRSLPSVQEDFSLMVNINTADAEQLILLPGIGETFAQRILDYREANGPFRTVEELLNVEGIGPGRLEAILDYITTGGNP